MLFGTILDALFFDTPPVAYVRLKMSTRHACGFIDAAAAVVSFLAVNVLSIHLTNHCDSFLRKWTHHCPAEFFLRARSAAPIARTSQKPRFKLGRKHQSLANPSSGERATADLTIDERRAQRWPAAPGLVLPTVAMAGPSAAASSSSGTVGQSYVPDPPPPPLIDKLDNATDWIEAIAAEEAASKKGNSKVGDRRPTIGGRRGTTRRNSGVSPALEKIVAEAVSRHRSHACKCLCLLALCDLICCSSATSATRVSLALSDHPRACPRRDDSAGCQGRRRQGQGGRSRGNVPQAQEAGGP